MQAPPQSVAIFDNQLSPLNNSSVIVACCMVIMNLGAKYLPLDLDSEIDELLQSSTMRKIVVFAILYLATRKFIYAVFGTLIFYIIKLTIFNKESKLSVLNLRTNKVNKTDNKINKDDVKTITDILSKTKIDEGLVKDTYDSKVDDLISKLNNI